MDNEPSDTPAEVTEPEGAEALKTKHQASAAKRALAGVAILMTIGLGAGIAKHSSNDANKVTFYESSSSDETTTEAPTTTTSTSTTTTTIPAPTTVATAAPKAAPRVTTRATTKSTSPSPPAPNTTAAPASNAVHPGAFCAPAGATGHTVTGLSMTCKTSDTDTRNRWRAS